jgi:hypothetical protein
MNILMLASWRTNLPAEELLSDDYDSKCNFIARQLQGA